ncbi:MAG: hypothetical protein WC378_03855 [Opitutaceae bacterium]|jgi:hypothetical protein
MTPAETLQQHQLLCDEIHQLALEENRFLKQNQRVPDAPLLDRKRALLARLEASLAALKATNISLNAESGGNATAGLDRELVEKVRSRVMQILHLDRENEQLLFRFSLGSGPKPANVAPPPSHLQRMYGSK